MIATDKLRPNPATYALCSCRCSSHRCWLACDSCLITHLKLLWPQLTEMQFPLAILPACQQWDHNQSLLLQVDMPMTMNSLLECLASLGDHTQRDACQAQALKIILRLLASTDDNTWLSPVLPIIQEQQLWKHQGKSWHCVCLCVLTFPGMCACGGVMREGTCSSSCVFPAGCSCVEADCS